MDTNLTPEYTTPPEYAIEPKKQVAKCYNRACMAMLFQLLIANAISLIGSMVYSAILMVQFMAEGITDQNLLVQKTTDAMSPAIVLLLTAIAYLIANPVSYLIGNAMTKKHYRAKAFGGIKLPAPDCLLAILAVLGFQGVSLLIQYGLSMLTGINGMDESTAAMLSFSDNKLQNIVLVIYTVVIAAVTEELLCRGLVLKLLSPVSKTFAVIGSAIIFGLMHGNPAQMFNGFLLGLILGYAAVKSKSVWLPILCHMAANTNAAVLMYFEHEIGEEFLKTELVYAVVLVAVAVVTIFLLIRRNGKIDNENDGYPVEQAIDVPEEEKPSCKGSLLVKTPCFWIYTVIYAITGIATILPQLA